ncbi:MAG TPA: S8 family serine peptidase [Mucilaginibacter sp.]|nr:S8 family serine peptidase [Mucilaginibacter sp.]
MSINIKRSFCLILSFILLVNLQVFAQTLPPSQPDPPKNWFALDLKTDGYFGVSLNQAYDFLNGKKSKTVVVAIIDSGCDTLQKDLQGVFWTNPKEKPNNNKDDDHNGYVNDIHGWDFLGGPGGKCDFNETEEEIRQYFRLKDKYANVTEATAPDKKQYAFWLTVKAQYDSTITKARTELPQLSPIMSALVETSGYVRHLLNLKNDQVFTKTDIQKLQATNDTLMQIKGLWTIAFSEEPDDATNVKVIKEMSEYLDKLNNEINPDLGARKRIVGDDPDVLDHKPYGNNVLKVMDSSHGTGVAGLVGAKRGNGYGIDGVADNVRLMIIKAVPNGDEYDKDVANAIRYAVDNGARVVNMSFGKKISPHKEWVDAAFKYAAAHDVLLVQAAGNENQDMDTKPEFPNDTFLDGSSDDSDNVIDVGASGPKQDSTLCASFSNYGKKNVDIFAPGVKVTSLDMDAETQTDDGTSFSSPIVTGIAALIREYYPSLSAKQVKQAIMQSATPLNGTMVLKPGTKQMVDFATLCKTGGIVNAYKALQNAAEMVGASK